jgi:hypothetical protein
MALLMKRDPHLLPAAGETLTQLAAITKAKCHVQVVLRGSIPELCLNGELIYQLCRTAVFRRCQNNKRPTDNSSTL